MGVHGLWKLLEPAGKAVALESLQNKVLGVDVSIWLHQVLKGFQDRSGSPLPNAHLLGLFHRICKLLFYRIKPVFVFDGGVPALKKNTIAARRKQKGRASRDAERLSEQLLKNLVKHKAVRKVLGEKAGRNAVSETQPRKDENLFALPPILEELNEKEVNSSDSDISVKYEPSGEDSGSDEDVKYLSPSKMYGMNLDLHTLDVTTQNFKSLPADVRHDILSDLKETRKQSSWGRLHEMPKESTDFSSFQLNRLLKRRTVQVSLEEAEKEMGGKVLSMTELQDLMSAQGVKLEEDEAATKVKDSQLNVYSKRIASDVATRFVLVSENSTLNEAATTSSQENSKEEIKSEGKQDKTPNIIEVNIKQEYQDHWSSDDEPHKVEKTDKKKVKIQQDFQDNWSSGDELNHTKQTENLAQQFITEKDSLSQEEILALIQNEKQQVSRTNSNSPDPDGPSTSEVVNRSPVVVESYPENKFEPVLPIQNEKQQTSQTSANSPDVPSTREVADRSPIAAKSDSENDFEQVSPNEPTVPPPHMQRGAFMKSKSIEVVINKSESYKEEDDIFADIFQETEVPEEMIKVTSQMLKGKPNMAEVPVVGSLIVPTMVTEIKNDTQAKSAKNIADISSKQTKRLTDGILEKSADLPASVDKPVVLGDGKELTAVEIDIGDDHKSSESEMEVVETDMKRKKGDEIITEEKETTEDEKLSVSPSKRLAVAGMSSEELQSLESALEEKHDQLMAEKGRQERLAASITDQMCAEAQELLRLFGVPYVVAPMEAEAQCAFLDALSLTEGTITDDSDIWLFGGRKVYKNFFNQKKHVLQYTSTTIQHYLKLERHHLVLLALLVGSDYTTGLQGIGPVTAMEVLAAFPPGKISKINLPENQSALLEGLRRFRDWWQAGRPERSARISQLRNKVKEVKFFEGFPSLAVVDAYLRPTVDESREVFTWGGLDLQGLREFARIKFGWAQAKVDEILLPVAKRYGERQSQRFIDSYFNAMPQFKEGEHKMSKRVKKAVRRMENEDDDESEDEEIAPRKTDRQKRTALSDGEQRKRKARRDKESSDSENEGTQRRTAARNRKKRLPTVEEESTEDQSQLPEANSVPQRTAKTRKRTKVYGGEEENSVPISKRTKTTKGTSEIPENDTAPTSEETLMHPQKSSGDEQANRKERSSSKKSEVPRAAQPRRRTCTGVIRTGVKTAPKEPSSDARSPEPITTESEKEKEHSSRIIPQKSAVKKTSQLRNISAGKTTSKSKALTARESGGQRWLDAILEEENVDDPEEIEAPDFDFESTGGISKKPPFKSLSGTSKEPKAGTSKETDFEPVAGSSKEVSFEPKPGSSKDNNEEAPDEEEEAILAALHAMDWDDNPWGDFEPPREKLFFGGVRKNRAAKPPRAPPQPPPQPLPIDTRGYRPGTRTLERIESRLTHPHLEWNSPAASIPQRDKDRQAAEESKMKAIKLFKAAGVVKSSKLLGAEPGNSKRKNKKKKPVTKVRELDLSEESSDD